MALIVLMKSRENSAGSTDKWLYIRAKFYVLNTMSVVVIGYLSRSLGKPSFLHTNGNTTNNNANG